MPTVILRLDETDKSIKTAIYKKLVADIARLLGMGEDSVTTIYGGIELSKTDNKGNATILQDPNVPSTVSQRRVTARVTSNYDEDSITPTTVTQRDVPPIYRDRSVDTCMTVIYIKSDTTIELEYKCPSKSEAGRLMDDLRVKISQAGNIMHHDVEYNIILPKAAEDFITDVYDLKNRLAPSTLANYIGEFLTNRAHVITDLTSTKNSRIAVREKQVRIVGTFDLSPLPDEYEKDNETNTYTLKLTYKLKLDIPTQLYITYPTMVANRPMPYKYLGFVKERRMLEKTSRGLNSSYARSLDAFREFEAHKQLSDRIRLDMPFSLPLFDLCDRVEAHPGYAMISTLLVSVDETDKKSLLNLWEIDEDFQLDSRFLELMAATELNRIVRPYETFFYLGVHQKGRHFDNNILEIDAQLNVKSKVELTLLRPVRIGLSLCINPAMIRLEAYLRIKQNRELFLYYLTELLIAKINFAKEFTSTGVTDEQLITMLTDVCVQASKNSELDFLKELVRTLDIVPDFAGKFSVHLNKGYPNLYSFLVKHTVISLYFRRNQTGKSYILDNNYLMKTVLSAYVDVSAKTDEASTKSKG